MRSSSEHVDGILAGRAPFGRGTAPRSPRGAIVEAMEQRTLLSAGETDVSFGEAGFAATDFPWSQDDVASVALIQNDGRIVLAGGTGGRCAVVRLLGNGYPDVGFGEGGTTALRQAQTVTDAIVAPDGRIIVASAWSAPPTAQQPNVGGFSLARFNSDGSLDRTFGDDGLVRTNLRFVSSGAYVGLQSDGRIIVAADANETPVVMRYNADGSADGSFGAAGRLWLTFEPAQTVRDVVVMQDDRIVCLTTREVFRLTSAGLMDAGFGGDGIVVLPEALGTAAAAAMQGESLIIGGCLDGDFTLARLGPDGTIDNTFGTGGAATADPGGYNITTALAVRPDGRIIAAGITESGDFQRLALAGFLPDGQPDADFNRGDRSQRTEGIAARSLAIGADGSLLVAGSVQGDAPHRRTTDFAVTRLDAAGNNDLDFYEERRGCVADIDLAVFADDRARAAVAAPGGKTIVVGESEGRLAIARYKADGSLDGGFGNGGMVLKDWGVPGRFADAAVSPGGQIVILGQLNGRYVLIRYNPDGRLDRTFGRNGRIDTGLAPRKRYAAAVLVQSEGKVLCAMSVRRAAVLCRYNSDGTLDRSFGNNGKTKIVNAAVDDMVLQKDGRIVAGGQMGGDFYLARFTARGLPDASFGGDGDIITHFGPPQLVAEVHKLALQPDGRIIAAGAAGSLALARYLPNGRLDKTFGTDGGTTRTQADGDPQTLRGLAIQTDGRIVAAGITRRTVAPGGPAVTDAIIVRYSRNGLLDGRFSNGGKHWTKLGRTVGADDDVIGCFIAADGDILVAGTHDGDFALGCFRAA